MQDNLRGYNLLKGVKNKAGVYKPDEKIYNSSLKKNTKRKPLSVKSEHYLRELLDYCRSENITNIVFTRFPHAVTYKQIARFKRTNTAGDIIAEYGYDFLNFEKDFDDTGLDTAVDFYNPDHMNVYGQKKFTEHLGGILRDKYGISESELTASQKSEWDKSVEYYEAYFKYSDSVIKNGEPRDIGENSKDMNEINKFL